ncbi:MAG: aldehyde dehydrogenase family protein, partial [Planctomycetota bacterium]
GYLVRRLDENTGPDNFLRHAFRLDVDGDAWRRLETAFIDSFDHVSELAEKPRRMQDRRDERSADASVRLGDNSPAEGAPHAESQRESSGFGGGIMNEPDTDWSLAQNVEWAERIVDEWAAKRGDAAFDVPLAIGDETVFAEDRCVPSIDPSVPHEFVARYVPATAAEADRAVSVAEADSSGWRRMPVVERSEFLHAVARIIAGRRGDLIGAMLAEGGKLVSESDPEVSEAIDFCRFYSESARNVSQTPGIQATGQGVAAVVSPWNFPLAIPCGGISAALAAGNTVILKPASDTVLTAYLLCKCFWDAGIPMSALQFLPCSGGSVGKRLVSHDAVATVILTGGTETAQRMLAEKPDMRLLAETGGKNATIVTALSDRDLAIKNVLHSAFSHSGQKCSATSLLILEEEVYHDRGFRDAMCDAVESLEVGSAWRLATRIGPLIRPPAGPLERALKELETGESWAVMPRHRAAGNPHLVGPGVKWDVAPGGFTHGTEFFGPLLGVMPAKNLHEAIDLVNATGYGLTSGLESLDEREHQLWQEGIRAGNLYINRPTTGAIVLRQPFGGMGKSCYGPGLKAGGPNYVIPLMILSEQEGLVDRPLGDAGATEGVLVTDDAAFTQPSLSMPHESFAERRRQLRV